jgi:hypothetical protein
MADDLVNDLHPGIEPPRRSPAGSGTALRTGIHAGEQFVEHLLVRQFDFPEIVPTRVIVQADMGNDESFIIRMLWIVFEIHSHDAPDKLDVSRETAKRSKYCGDAEPRMIESFPQHLHLHNAIKAIIPERIQNDLTLLLRHVTVDFGGAETPLPVERAYVSGMIDGACTAMI